MSPLKVELYNANADDWLPVAEIDAGEPNGSFSDNLPDGTRDVYMFGVDRENERGFVLRSLGGLDIEVSDTRRLDSLGFDEIASLTNGESYEMMIKTDKSPDPRIIRFQYKV